MNRHLDEIAVFLKVAEMGSFSGAARQLVMPNSTVSAKVSLLEKELGVTLIKRTTRRLFVTEAGQEFYKRCAEGLAHIKAAEEQITQTQVEPMGRLRITAPVELGAAVLPKVALDFRRKFPKVILDFDLSDRQIDLVSEGFDIAIRAGELKDSSLIGKRLGTVYFAPFASAAYLKNNRKPQNPKELRDHNCLQFSPIASQEMILTGPKGRINVPVQPVIVANDLNLIKALVLAGQGIALLPTFYCLAEIRQQKLIRILPEWRANIAPVHFVYPAQKFVAPKLSAFIEVATDIMKEYLAPDL